VQNGKVAKEECKMLRLHKALDLMDNLERLSKAIIGFAQNLCYIYHVSQNY
jgi:hypothetical protein